MQGQGFGDLGYKKRRILDTLGYSGGRLLLQSYEGSLSESYQIMNLLQAIILGIVQGLSEFLPISSSGHLALANHILGVEGDNLMYFLLLHIATLLSVFTVFFRDILGLFRKPFKTLGLVILATIPAVLTGMLLSPLVGRAFGDLRFLTLFFLITAILLYTTEILVNHKKKDGNMLIVEKKDKDIGLKVGLIMGFSQALALFPGLSRSGTTISSGLLAGGDRKKVAKFSFFMSIPITLGATVFEGAQGVVGGTLHFSPYMLLGMIAAYISGVLALILMMKVIPKINFKWFSLYLVAIAIICFGIITFV